MDDVFSLEFAKEGVFSEAYKVNIQRNTGHLQHACCIEAVTFAHTFQSLILF
jgi:hypothetical protein